MQVKHDKHGYKSFYFIMIGIIDIPIYFFIYKDLYLYN